MQWYVQAAGKVQGPYTPAQMRKLCASGRMHPEFKITRDRLHWFRADEVFEFGARGARRSGRSRAHAPEDLPPPVTPPSPARLVLVVLLIAVGVAVLAAVLRG